MIRKRWENLNKKRELRNNKNVKYYGCLLRRILYCAGNGQELLSTLGVTLVCHASNLFLVLKVSLSIIGAFSKSMAWLLDQAWLISNFRTFGRSFGVYQMFFFPGIKSSARLPQCNTTNSIFTRNFIPPRWSVIPSKVGISELGTVVVAVVNGLFTTVTSCLLGTRVKGSVTPLM